MDRAVRWLLIVGGAYVAAQMMADIASLRIISVGGYAINTLEDTLTMLEGADAAKAMRSTRAR